MARSRFRSMVLLVLLSALGATACAGPLTPKAPERGGSPGSGAPTAPKRITAAISGDPKTVYANFGAAGVRGADALNALVNSGFSTVDDTNTLRPLLAEAVPTVENGLWQVFPDGTMTTTWRIRDGARWHDGTPLTAEDLTFTARVLRDRDLPFPLEAAALRGLQEIEAPDDRTVIARWGTLSINADRIFGAVALPLPKHLLENAYVNAKGSFTDLSYWRDGFVGNGPYRIREWNPGSSISLRAFDDYVPARSRIDEIEMRFVLDANTLVAQVLASEIDITLGRSFSPEQGILVRQQWRDGRVDVGSPSSALNIWAQFRDPTPAVVADVRFRRALFKSLDRSAMAESLESGLVTATDSWLVPTLPEYAALQHYIARYPYDPRAAAHEIEALGYTRGTDGQFRDADGPLSLELRSIALPDINARTQLIVRDYWQQVGITVDSLIVPAQNTDPAMTRNFPGFLILRFPADVVAGASALHSRTPPRGSYVNAELDSLIERYEVTIPRGERMELAGQIVQHMTEQLAIMPLFYDPGIGFVKHRLRNVPTLGDQPPWNVHDWDLAP